MKSITIRQLHDATGKWVRRAAALGELQVTERGRRIARLVATMPRPEQPYFSRRKFLPAFRTARPHLHGGTDSTQTISDDRDHAGS